MLFIIHVFYHSLQSLIVIMDEYFPKERVSEIQLC